MSVCRVCRVNVNYYTSGSNTVVGCLGFYLLEEHPLEEGLQEHSNELGTCGKPPTSTTN